MPEVRMKLRKTTRGGSVFWTASCKEDSYYVTGATESEAALSFTSHMKKHPGSTIKRV